MKILHTFKVDNQEFQLVRPNWQDENNSRRFFKSQVRKEMDAGVLCEEAMRRKLLDGEIGGESVKKELDEMKVLKDEIEEKFKVLNSVKKENGETKEIEEQIKALLDKYQFLEEDSFGKVKHLTAEHTVKEQLFDWHVVNFTYKDGKPFFEGKTFEDKMEKLHEAFDDNELLEKVYQKSRFYFTVIGAASRKFTAEDWEKLDKQLDEAGI